MAELNIAEQGTVTTPLAVSVDEAGRLLGISRDLVYSMAARGELTFIRLGRRIVIPMNALEKIVAASG